MLWRDIMNLKDTLLNRRSCREFLDKEISDDILIEILNSARLAPSGGNSQNRVFGIVKDEKRKYDLAKVAGKQMWIAKAPVVIACCADISWDIADQPEDDFGLIVNNLRFGKDFVKYLSAYEDRARANTFVHNGAPLISCAYMSLVAVEHGLRSCIVGYLDTEKASKILELPDNKVCLFLMAIGYPVAGPGVKSLKCLDEISFYETWE